MEAPPDTLATLRSDAIGILLAGINAADPATATRNALQVGDDAIRLPDARAIALSPSGRIWIVGAGKAAGRMAQAAVEALTERVAGGTITVPRGSEVSIPGVEVWAGGHPISDIRGMAGAAEALTLARRMDPGDLLLCLLSGGASALWAAPAVGLTLADLQGASAALLASGAPIGEMNTVRKHLSRIGGGGLARAAPPGRVLTLAVSDVVEAPLDAIGSGPTLPDPSTYEEALEVVRRYSVDLPPAALHHLRLGVAGGLHETLDPGELAQENLFHVVLDLRSALVAAAEAATERGYATRVVTATLQGEARDVGARIAVEAEQALSARSGAAALLWGGETTVTLRGNGLGGRNQELALAAAVGLRDTSGLVIAAIGTDGRDGPTDAAGAIVDGGTLARGREAGMDPSAALHANDSHTFLRASGDLVVTGPTGTNVNDLVLALIRPS